MKRFFKIALPLTLIIATAYNLLPWIQNRIKSTSPMPNNLGLDSNGRLATCPNSPNCVSTSADPSDKQHYIAPIQFAGTAVQAQAELTRIINNMERNTIIRNELGYLHAEFRSSRMGFIDDVEFHYGDEVEGDIINMRSAARLGYGDMEANRQRLEQIRLQFGR